MIPAIIHQIWLGPQPFPAWAGRWQTHIQQLHPTWTYRLWTEETIDTLPDTGLLQCCRTQSSRANVVRLSAIDAYGGIYLDCDCQVLKPLDELLVYDAFAALESDRRLCNAVFGATPGHPWVQWQVGHLSNFVDQEPPWGPALMTAAPRHGLTIVPTDYFYPFLWSTPVELRKPKSHSFLMHHWMKSWKR